MTGRDAAGTEAHDASIPRAPQQSDDAFDLLYRECWPRAVATATRLTQDRGRAEELAQEAFIRAYDRWRQVRKHPAPDAWILRTLNNLAIDDARRRARRPTAPLRAEDTHATTQGHERSAVIGIAVRDALASLPPKQRDAVMLRYISGLEESEIAAAIDVQPGTVKTHLKRGTARLRELLGDDDPFESSVAM
jgi:RNA polymerase sigma-70 factor (ECF subfamily)